MGGPDYYSSRSYKYSWDLGHLLFFAAWTNLLIISWKWISDKQFYWQCFWILSISLIFGVMTEFAQIRFGRSASRSDLMMDMIGSGVTLFFFSSSRKSIAKSTLMVVQIFIVIIIITIISPLAIALTDEIIAKEQFPVLGDFETLFEEKRWSAETKIARNSSIAVSGKYSLQVQLDTTKYSGVHLKYFDGDWREYHNLKFSIFHSSSNDLEIHCRIHDWEHILNGEEYSDRFNTKYRLSKGWNNFEICFDQIISAPKGREMNMGNIKEFGLFVVRLSKPETIYIDNVRLCR